MGFARGAPSVVPQGEFGTPIALPPILIDRTEFESLVLRQLDHFDARFRQLPAGLANLFVNEQGDGAECGEFLAFDFAAIPSIFPGASISNSISHNLQYLRRCAQTVQDQCPREKYRCGVWWSARW